MRGGKRRSTNDIQTTIETKALYDKVDTKVKRCDDGGFIKEGFAKPYIILVTPGKFKMFYSC